MQVMDMNLVFDGAETIFIGCAVGATRFDTAASHPNRKTFGVVFTANRIFFAGIVLTERRVAELAGPHDQGVNE